MIDLHPKYKPLFTAPTRYFILTGGRGSSKSFSQKTWEVLLTYERGHTILDTRYTMNSSKDSTLPEFQEKVEILEQDHSFDLQALEATNLTSGSRVLFRGIKQQSKDQTAKLKSLQGVTTWVLDEAEEMTDEALFDRVDFSIRQKGIQNRVILIMNPSTKAHWIYKRFFQDAGVQGGFNGIKGDVCYIHTTYLDNLENLSQSFIDQIDLMKERNPAKYDHIIMGGWLDRAEGVIFPNWEYGTFDEGLRSMYGQDYGFKIDPTTLVKVGVCNKRMEIHCKVELYEVGMSTAQIGEVNKRVCGREHIVGDNAEPRLISELQRYCRIMPCTKGKGSVTAGIKRMQDYKIVVHDDELGQKMGEELNNYTWVSGKDSVPLDLYNHCIDAVRYAFDKLNKGKVTLG